MLLATKEHWPKYALYFLSGYIYLGQGKRSYLNQEMVTLRGQGWGVELQAAWTLCVSAYQWLKDSQVSQLPFS